MQYAHCMHDDMIWHDACDDPAEPKVMGYAVRTRRYDPSHLPTRPHALHVHADGGLCAGCASASRVRRGRPPSHGARSACVRCLPRRLDDDDMSLKTLGVELYDHGDDVIDNAAESINVAEQHADVVQQLSALLEQQFGT